MALPDPGPVAQRAADDAVRAIGTHEDGPPYNNAGDNVEVYLSTVGLGPGYPWCAAFVAYREVKAAHELEIDLPADFPRGGFAAAAANWADWAKKRGAWFTHATGGAPRKGDLVCFDIASEGGIHHIGIVLSADAAGITTVEGNTHAQGDVVRDGYCVAQRRRGYGEIGAGGGFVRLGW